MATLSQIKVGQITYDICDVPTLNNLKSIKSSVDQINTKIDQINYNKSTGLQINRFNFVSKSESIANNGTGRGYSLTMSLPSYPFIGIYWVNGTIGFAGTGHNPKTMGDTALVEGRIVIKNSSSITSWTRWDYQYMYTLVYRNEQRCQLSNAPNLISECPNGRLFAFEYKHNNTRALARTCSSSGWINIIWSDPYPTTKTFSRSATSTSATVTYN